MKIVNKSIKRSNLDKMAKGSFGNLVKAVVDIKKGVMVVDVELHADAEAYLLERDSKQDDLWGINLYPGKKAKEFIEFDSMINVRPSAGNLSRGIEDEEIRKKVSEIVNKLVKK